MTKNYQRLYESLSQVIKSIYDYHSDPEHILLVKKHYGDNSKEYFEELGYMKFYLEVLKMTKGRDE